MNASGTPARITASGARSEGWLVLGLFVAGLAIGLVTMDAFRANGETPKFYQDTFEPAVMAVCGHGLARRVAVDPTAPSALDDFLAQKRDRLTCADLSRPLQLSTDVWKGTWFYLFLSAAAVWRVTGIAWTSLDVLCAIFVGLTACALYGVFRAVAAAAWAAVLTLLLLLSPLHLAQVPMLRDYSKAPFVLAALLLLITLVRREWSGRVTIACAAAFGAVVGIGYGFRTDLIVLVPIGLLTVLALTPRGLFRGFRITLPATAALAGMFIAAASPVFLALRGGGGCQFHVALLGLTSPFTRELGLQPSIYNFGAHYNDAAIDLKVGDYSQRILAQKAPGLCSPGYETASSFLTRDTIAQFPADILVRAYASVIAISSRGLILPEAPGFVTGRVPTAMYHAAHRLTEPLARFGALMVGASIVAVWAMNVRLGIALFLLIAYVGGYPAVQFEGRHWFHLQFIPWWMASLLVMAVRHRATLLPNVRIARVAAAVVCLVLLPPAVLAAARAYQTLAVTEIVRTYEGASTAPVDFGAPAQAGGAAAVPVQWRPVVIADGPNERASDLLKLTVGGADCKASPLPVTVRYVADVPTHDLTETIDVERTGRGSNMAHVYVPVFALTGSGQPLLRFSRVELPSGSEPCLTAVSRVTDRRVPRLWMTLQVSPDNPIDRPLFETMRGYPVFGRLARRILG